MLARYRGKTNCLECKATSIEIYTLSLHVARPFCVGFDQFVKRSFILLFTPEACEFEFFLTFKNRGSEEHTSELQSRLHIVCRLLLEKQKIDFPLSKTIYKLTKEQYDLILSGKRYF